jgi:hypothetical protein
MAAAITNSLAYHLLTSKGQASMAGLLNGHMPAGGVEVATYPIEIKVSIDIPGGAGAITLEAEVSTFSDNRKVILGFTSPSLSSTLFPLFFYRPRHA